MGKSTGPRTPRGKARSSRNAAKHWINSGRILPEEQKDAAALRSGFEERFKPQGLIEQEVIDDLVFNRLIKRRIDVAFAREDSKASIETTVLKEIERYERSAAQYWLRMAGLEPAYSSERERAERLHPRECIRALERLQRGIRDYGLRPDDDLATLRAAYGDQPTEIAALAMYLLRFAAEKKAETKDDAGLKKAILAVLGCEIEGQQIREALAPRMSDVGCESDQEPRRATLDTLLRYRATNTRDFRDSLDSLERIRRLGGSTA